MNSLTKKTSLGFIRISGDDKNIQKLEFVAQNTDSQECPLLLEAFSQLDAYLAGKLRKFTLPLAPHGTDFQRRVWAALCGVPYGETATYRQIAEAVGRPTAVRAVGNANGKNPTPIFIPCHRIIRTDGTLGGYSCGIEIKRKLLRLEAIH
jgi:methylated-DNA-[protein]-cysteine S-methyltransferase